MPTAVICGAVANKCWNGGNAWTRLQWVLGLQNLGFEVQIIEQIGPHVCVDAGGETTSFAESVNLAYFREVAEEFGLAQSATLLLENSGEHWGLNRAQSLELIAETDLLINIGGHLDGHYLARRAGCAVYIDDDPGYTQFWHAAGQLGQRLAGYDAYYTVGANIGSPGCSIPCGDLPWRPMRPFVVLEHWPASDVGDPERLTTVASWRGAYGPVDHDGTVYGVKAHEFRKFVDVPRCASQRFEIALDIHPAETRDLELLTSHGWQLVDPRAVASHPSSYRRYLAHSGAEFSAAQAIYVATRSGWFSDRTACYLACGKPAVVQDTGFSCRYPTGDGLLAFETIEQAVERVRCLARDYEHHGHAARALAEAYFDSNVVLGDLVDQLGIAP